MRRVECEVLEKLILASEGDWTGFKEAIDKLRSLGVPKILRALEEAPDLDSVTLKMSRAERFEGR